MLVAMPRWVGDAVMAEPVLRLLHARWPDARITVFTRPGLADLYRAHPAVGEIFPREDQGAWPLIRLARELRRGRFDFALLLPNAFRVAWLARAAGIPFRLGYAGDGRGWLLSHRVERPQEAIHQTQYYLRLMDESGGLRLEAQTSNLPPQTLYSSVPTLAVADEHQERADRLLRAKGWLGEPLLAVHPGAAFGPAKRWPAASYRELLTRIAGTFPLRILLLGSREEQSLALAVSEGVSPDPLSLIGETTLGEAMGVLRRCRLVVGNDSGLIHLAAALGQPVVGLFGPSDPRITGLSGPGHQLLRYPVECSPCRHRACPIDHRCMAGISVDQVYEAVLRGEVSPHSYRGAVFLDRDGTVTREVGYLKDNKALDLLSGASEAIRQLNAAGLQVFLATNQSAVGRGYFPVDQVEAAHQRLSRLLEQEGARLDGIYWCPHAPEEGCDCRKPATGLLQAAAREHGIDLTQSYLVGDKAGDLACAAAVGAKGVLVLTGYGETERDRLEEPPAHVARDLGEAVAWILEDRDRFAQKGGA
ncbi:MAG: lipopolysaccharide heptosyltransferase II [Nitrospirae bacterium]|nr:lipopolysaccharide heptosyltransferase II [Nitrospirota bacterium]